MRIGAVCLAVLLAASMPAAATELKPKFGDIGGVYYTDVSENREACRQAIGNKIALCRQNTSFVSNTEDRKYPGCLPIFRQQAGVCVAHFRRQTSKCEVFGSARIDDFTGFSCEVTKTVVEEGGEPGVTPADRQAGRPAKTRKSSGPDWVVAGNQPCEVWNPRPNFYKTATWSGGCVGGKASGAGRLVWRFSGGTHVFEGEFGNGKIHGYGTRRTSSGSRYEGEFRNGKQHGRGTYFHSSGSRFEGEWRNGKWHGRGTFFSSSGSCAKVHYDNGKRLSSKEC